MKLTIFATIFAFAGVAFAEPTPAPLADPARTARLVVCPTKAIAAKRCKAPVAYSSSCFCTNTEGDLGQCQGRVSSQKVCFEKLFSS